MKAIAFPYHQKLKFSLNEGIVVIKGKQKDTRYCFGLAMQTTLALAEKRPAKLAESLQDGSKGEETEQENQGKMKEITAEMPEISR